MRNRDNNFLGHIALGLFLEEPKALLHWDKPIQEIIESTRPIVEKYSRWESKEGAETGIKRTLYISLFWKKIQISGITAINRAAVKLKCCDNETTRFTEINLYASDIATLKSQLLETLGAPLADRREFLDKGGMAVSISDLWRPHPNVLISHDGLGCLSIRHEAWEKAVE